MREQTCQWLLVAAIAFAGCGDEGAPPVDESGWNGEASAFLEEHCVRCHQGNHSGGDYTIYEEVETDAAAIRCGLASEELDGCAPPMPDPRTFPTGPRPPADDIKRFIGWLEDGLPR